MGSIFNNLVSPARAFVGANQFAFLAAGLIALVPILIHLINMFRHRRVDWAPMRFLLLAYKKQRNWVRLRQWLLLLARIAAMVAVIALFSKLRIPDEWASMMGGENTVHHYVLLDDSYSMSDHSGGKDGFDRAKAVLSTLAERAASRKLPQKLTVLRYSRGMRAAKAPQDALKKGSTPADTAKDAATKEGQGKLDDESILDMRGRTADPTMLKSLKDKLDNMKVTDLAVGPDAAVDVVKKLIDGSDGEKPIVYLLTDFRTEQWANPSELRSKLQELELAGADIHLVNCVKPRHRNLAISRITPVEQTKAVGVPLYVDVEITNFGTEVALNVPLTIRSMSFGPEVLSPEKLANLGATFRIATKPIERIDPGQTIRRRRKVTFSDQGHHVIEAILPDDEIAADNHRYCVAHVLSSVPVLLVDGDSKLTNGAYYLKTVFEPKGRTVTGIAPRVVLPSFLRDQSQKELNAYHAIYLMNVPRLDADTVTKLKSFVAAGGGLVVSLGPKSELNFYNSLYEEGKGLLPVSLRGDARLAPADSPEVSDVVPVKCPIFNRLVGKGYNLLQDVAVQGYYQVRKDWKPSPKSKTKILARLRNKDPLIVRSQFGKGRVVVMLSSVGRTWNNWAKTISFVPVMLNLQSYVAAPHQIKTNQTVGTPIDVKVDADAISKTIAFYSLELPTLKQWKREQKNASTKPRPGESGTLNKNSRMVHPKRFRTEKLAVAKGKDAKTLRASLGRETKDLQSNGETDRRAIYEAWEVVANEKVRGQRYALNVDPQEGNVATVSWQALKPKLGQLKARYHESEKLEDALGGKANSDGGWWREIVLALLICFLVGEQALAYLASYHPAASRGAQR